MKSLHWKTLLSLVVMSFLSTGSACDENPDMITSTPGSSFERNATATPNRAVNDPTTTTSPDRTTTTTSRDAAPGNQTRGESCNAESRCTSGLACEGNICVQSGVLRASIIWDTELDLDLHVQTPLGEELYYRNRVGSGGGQFLKDGCIADNCEAGATKIESVLWASEAPNGTFEAWAVNYDGEEAASFRVEIRKGDSVETFNGSVAAGEGAESSRFVFTYDDSSTGPGNLKIVSHDHEEWVTGSSQTFVVDANDDAITRVSYTADGRYELGESTRQPGFQHAANFTNLGERKIKASGFNDEGFELDNKEITIVVTDENGGLPSPATGAVVSERLLAKRIQHHSGSFDLYPINVSGVDDGADAQSNIDDAANGQTARTSCYGNAPCARTNLDPRMLQAMVIIKHVHGFSMRVTSIAGGSHSSNSRHYSGRAFDVDTINGSPVSSNGSAVSSLMQVCRDLGATEVLGPGNAGHAGHVHCAW